MSGPETVAAGDPGQGVRQLRPVDTGPLAVPDEKALGGLAGPTVLVVAVVCILKPLQGPEILDQGEIGRAVVGQAAGDLRPSGLQPQKFGIMQIHLSGDIGIPKANDLDLSPGEIQAAIKPGRVKAGYRLKL